MEIFDTKNTDGAVHNLLNGNLTIQQKGDVPNNAKILESTDDGDFASNLQKKFSFFNKKTVGVGLLTTIALATGLTIGKMNPNEVKVAAADVPALTQNNKVENNEKPSILDNVKSSIQSTISSNNSNDSVSYNGKQFKLYTTKTDKYQISDHVKDNVEKVAQFDIPSNLAPNQMARHAARVKFQQGMANKSPMDLELSFLSEMEGFVGAQPYKDNIGWAIGSGWNLSLQNSNYNKFLSGTISNNPEVIKSLTAYSGTSNSVNPGKIPENIEYQRFSQVSMIMLDRFKEAGVYPALGNALKRNPKGQAFYKEHGNNPVDAGRAFFETLPPTLQAPASYLSYNAGSEGYKKFVTFNDGIVNYAFTPENQRTSEQRQSIINSGTPTFVLNGTRMENTKFKQLFSSLFNSDNGLAYGAYVKANPAPKNMASYFTATSSKVNNGNGSVNGNVDSNNLSSDGQWLVVDPIGDAKRDAIRKGEKLDMHLDYSQFMPEQKVAPKKPRRGIPAAWG